jgi:hypothetical protein
MNRNSRAFVSWKDRKLDQARSEGNLPGGNSRGGPRVRVPEEMKTILGCKTPARRWRADSGRSEASNRHPAPPRGGRPDARLCRERGRLWPIDQLRSEFEASCAQKSADPAEEITRHLGSDIDPETLWQQIKTNLQAGRIRMLFVADRIPPELRRIVEFLNQQMNPAEVLALELRHFAGEGLKTIVPMVYGQTERAQQEKAVGGPKRQWDEESVLADLAGAAPRAGTAGGLAADRQCHSALIHADRACTSAVIHAEFRSARCD